MTEQERPRAVQRFILSMYVLGAVYAFGVILFYFFPGFVFTLLNIMPAYFGVLGELPASTEHFWLPLAASMMLMLSIVAFGSARDPENRTLVVAHAGSKLCTSMGYLYMFLVDERYFAYLVGFLTDFPIFLFVLWITAQARAQRE